MVSLPGPPSTFSMPVNISMPSPVFCLALELRLMRLARALNKAVSLPAPPTNRSFPNPPFKLSLPFPPISLLAAELPVMVSLPPPPLTFSIKLKISIPSPVFWLELELRLI